ncbi:unnamed protein product [Cochlearia groenlandica]
MDGLIPMAFKAMKKNRTRRRYECLSSSAAAAAAKDSHEDYDSFPFSTKSDHSVVVSRRSSSRDHQDIKNGGALAHHRRGWSVEDFSSISCREGRNGVNGGGGGIGVSPSRRGQLVRNRSHRLFSCVSSGQ